MSSRLAAHCLAIAFAAMALGGGEVQASGLVIVAISPDDGPPGTKISVTARGFLDQGKTTFAPPTYWAEISVGSTKVATNVPVAADLSVTAQDIVVDARPGDHMIAVTMYARDANGTTRYIDDGGKLFHVIDPGPVHPLTIAIQVTAPPRALASNDVVINVALQSGAGDKTKVGLYAGVFDHAGKLVQSLRFPAAAGAPGAVTDRIEMMDANRNEQFTSEPFQLAPGTWRIHVTLLVNNVAHDTDRSIIVTAEKEPAPHKLPPHVVPGTRN